MKIKGKTFSFNYCSKWFSDKGELGQYIIEAKNKEERKIRLTWLSEGSLTYHLTQFKSEPPPNSEEKLLFLDFINSLK